MADVFAGEIIDRSGSLYHCALTTEEIVLVHCDGDVPIGTTVIVCRMHGRYFVSAPIWAEA